MYRCLIDIVCSVSFFVKNRSKRSFKIFGLIFATSVYILLPVRMYFSLLFIKPFHRQMCFKGKYFIKQKAYEKDFICFVGDMYISFCQCAGVSFYATYRSEFC